MRRRSVAAAAALLLTAANAPPRDWAALARADAIAFHDDVVANHPGPYNRRDPDFSARERRAYQLALLRVASRRDLPGYFWAMAGYAASFDDGHLAISFDEPVTMAGRWPGFLTSYGASGRQRVTMRADDAPVPLGAELTGCDGVYAPQLALTRVGAFFGRWSLASQRAKEGWRVLVDASNPFAPPPVRCDFKVAGITRSVTLTWRDLSRADADRASALEGRAHPAIGAHVLPDGTRWLILSGFNGDPDSTDAKALRPLIADLVRNRATLMVAPRILLDLRGNNGGSSDWSRQVAEAIWGENRVAAVRDPSWVEWRASAANLATLTAARDQFARSADADTEMKAFYGGTVSGIAGARAAGRPLWRAPSDPVSPSKRVPPLSGPPVYVLTDRGCGSACLDAADLWLALGAVQVGQETSADTLYLDIRADPLPSGMAHAVVPMKVWRDRPRGSNQSLIPRVAYGGDLRDTAALERWVERLPGR